jgi:hypothetical protein
MKRSSRQSDIIRKSSLRLDYRIRVLCSKNTPAFSSSSYTYSTPHTWDTPPPSPTVVSKFPYIVSTHPLDILPRVAPEPFSLESLM